MGDVVPREPLVIFAIPTVPVTASLTLAIEPVAALVADSVVPKASVCAARAWSVWPTSAWVSV